MAFTKDRDYNPLAWPILILLLLWALAVLEIPFRGHLGFGMPFIRVGIVEKEKEGGAEGEVINGNLFPSLLSLSFPLFRSPSLSLPLPTLKTEVSMLPVFTDK